MSQQKESDFVFKKINDIYKKLVLPKHSSLPVELKPEQTAAIDCLLSGQDLLLLLPTGFGKSLVYTVPGLIQCFQTKTNTITVIVAPLVALILDSMTTLEANGLQARHVTNCEQLKDIMNYLEHRVEKIPIYIFASPEVLIKREIKLNLKRLKVNYLIVDEGHVTAEWGDSFREDYGCLYELRACVDCPLGVFTATVTDDIIREIYIKTGLKKDNLVTIAVNPDRPNIFLSLQEPTNDVKLLTNLALEILQKKKAAEKTIIFVTSVTTTYQLFLWFQDLMGCDSVYTENGVEHGFMVNYYSAETESAAKRRMEEQFRDPNGFLRCLIATVAFGMGVNIPDIRRVIIWGLPATPMTLWQEIGRAGRDSKPAIAAIFPFKTPGFPHGQNYQLIKDGCVRKHILNLFHSPQGTQQLTASNCCSFCKGSTFDATQCIIS